MVQRLGAVALLGMAVFFAGLVSSGSSSGAEPARSEAAPKSRATPVVGNKIVLVVALKRTRVGTFAAHQAVSDAGKAHGRVTITGNRIRLILTLRSRNGYGTMTILVTQLCGKPKGSWKMLLGSRTYAGLAGGGSASGRFVCSHKAPYRGVLTGSVRLPPPGPLANPGLFRGTRPALSLRVSLEVESDGRRVTNVSVRQIIARCGSSRILFLERTFAGPYSIGADKTLSIVSEGYEVSMTFSSKKRAVGTVTYAADGCKAGPLSWKTKNPPDPLPDVSHGRYCGFMLSGPGICLDVTSDAWVTNVHMSANLRCTDRKTFQLDYTYQGVIAIRPDRRFSIDLAAVPLDGGGSMRWRIAGTFGNTGRVDGTGGFGRISLVRDGTGYRCQSAMTGWSAKLGA